MFLLFLFIQCMSDDDSVVCSMINGIEQNNGTNISERRPTSNNEQFTNKPRREIYEREQKR